MPRCQKDQTDGTGYFLTAPNILRKVIDHTLQIGRTAARLHLSLNPVTLAFGDVMRTKSIIPMLAGPHFDHIVQRSIQLRHRLHQCPELGYHEKQTSALIAGELRRLKIPVTTGLAGGTGLTGLITGSGRRCVALRGEMDALPVQEQTGKAWASRRPGVMHACGHDGHTSMVLGAAAWLSRHRSLLPGQVKLLFQPAEEGLNGALRMCESGALDRPNVAAVFGLHGWPPMNIGHVATRSGVFLAAVDTFEIQIRGRGTHAAYPHKGINPIACGAAIVEALAADVSREIDPSNTLVLTIATFNAGTAPNIIPDLSTITGTLRTLTPATRRSAKASMARICKSIGVAHRCQVQCRFTSGTPATVNSAAGADLFERTAGQILGKKNVSILDKPFLWSEDFAYYLQRCDGCFFALGVKPPAIKEYPMLHNPRYDFPDTAMATGIRMLIALAVGYLAGDTIGINCNPPDPVDSNLPLHVPPQRRT